MSHVMPDNTAFSEILRGLARSRCCLAVLRQPLFQDVAEGKRLFLSEKGAYRGLRLKNTRVLSVPKFWKS